MSYIDAFSALRCLESLHLCCVTAGIDAMIKHLYHAPSLTSLIIRPTGVIDSLPSVDALHHLLTNSSLKLRVTLVSIPILNAKRWKGGNMVPLVTKMMREIVAARLLVPFINRLIMQTMDEAPQL